VLFSYVVELYGSRRFAHLDAAYRHATCMQVLHHYAEHLDEDGTIDEAGAPPFQRRRSRQRVGQRFQPAGRPVTVCSGGDGCKHSPACRRAQVVPSADKVASRGRSAQHDEEGESDGGLSPAGELRPARVRGIRLQSSSTLPDEVAFYDEVVALLVCVLEQYDEAHEVRSRVRREQLLLAFALARDLDANASRRTMESDEGVWWRNLQRVVLSPHLTVGARAITDEFNSICGRIVQVKPGEQLDRQVHGLEALDEVRARHQAPSLIAEKLWGLEAEFQHPLGRVPRQPSKARAALVARRRRRDRHGAPPEGCRSSDGEVSSASDTEARVSRPAPATTPARRGHNYLPRAQHGGGGVWDNDPTQPTQGLEALLGAAAASDPASARCTYCGRADAAAGDSGALWRCQLCGRGYCHSGCCEGVVQAAFGPSNPPEHVCTVCASQELRSRCFVDRASQSAVLGALRAVVHPIPLALRLRSPGGGPRLLLALQRALCQLVDAAHARAVLHDEVRAEALAHRIALGGVRGLAMLDRDPRPVIVEQTSALLARLEGRLARLALPDADDASSDEGGGIGRPVAGAMMARAVMRTLSNMVRVIHEAIEDSDEEEEEGESEVPAALRRGCLGPEARARLKRLQADVDVGVMEKCLLQWVEGRLASLLPLRRAQVARAFDARAEAMGGRAKDAGSLPPGGGDGHEGDISDGEPADASAALGTTSGQVFTRHTHAYRRRLSIFPLVELRMIGNAHVWPATIEQMPIRRPP